LGTKARTTASVWLEDAIKIIASPNDKQFVSLFINSYHNKRLMDF
jgi:hypothetical protein